MSGIGSLEIRSFHPPGGPGMEDRKQWRSKKFMCYNLAQVRGKSWVGGSQTQGEVWQRRLERLWSSAVWKTSDFVVLVYYDNKSQLPHSVDSHQPPPKMDKQV